MVPIVTSSRCRDGVWAGREPVVTRLARNGHTTGPHAQQSRLAATDMAATRRKRKPPSATFFGLWGVMFAIVRRASCLLARDGVQSSWAAEATHKLKMLRAVQSWARNISMHCVLACAVQNATDMATQRRQHGTDTPQH
jgi:hypothetical protein